MNRSSIIQQDHGIATKSRASGNKLWRSNEILKTTRQMYVEKEELNHFIRSSKHIPALALWDDSWHVATL